MRVTVNDTATSTVISNSVAVAVALAVVVECINRIMCSNYLKQKQERKTLANKLQSYAYSRSCQ